MLDVLTSTHYRHRGPRLHSRTPLIEGWYLWQCAHLIPLVYHWALDACTVPSAKTSTTQ